MAGKRSFGNRKRTKFSPSRTKRNGRLYAKRWCVSDKTEDIRISSEREMSYSNGSCAHRVQCVHLRKTVFHFSREKNPVTNFFDFFFFTEFIYFYVPSFRDTSFRHSAKEKEFLSTTLVGHPESLCRARPGREIQDINLGADVLCLYRWQKKKISIPHAAYNVRRRGSIFLPCYQGNGIVSTSEQSARRLRLTLSSRFRPLFGNVVVVFD